MTTLEHLFLSKPQWDRLIDYGADQVFWDKLLEPEPLVPPSMELARLLNMGDRGKEAH